MWSHKISGDGLGTRTQVSLASNPVTFTGVYGMLKLQGLSFTTKYFLESKGVIAEEET